MIDSAILYRIGNGGYAVSVDTNTSEPREVFLVRPPSAQTDGESVRVVTHEDMQATGLSVPFPQGKYLLLDRDRTIAFEKLHGALHLSPTLRNDAFEARTFRIVERFRRRMWQQLIDCVYSSTTGVKEVLSRLLSHTFSDHYSLWLYNEHTKHFHLHCASFTTNRQYVADDDEDATLGEMLDPDCHYVNRAVLEEKVNSDPLSGMHWLNRFRVDTGAGLIAIVSFYSERMGFTFSERTCQLIPEIVSSKLAREFSPYLDKHLRVRNLAEDYSPGSLKAFLETALPRLNTLIGWESISIFLADESKPGYLTLSALAANGSNISCPSALYDLSKQSLTCCVYSEAKLAFSYDIANDSRNTHGFDEPTIRRPENWVGIPIARPRESPVGVLRVLNKLSADGKIVPFNALDIDLLQNIASIVAYLCHIEDAFQRRELAIQADLSKQEAENKQLNEFLKTFRHELKSPLTVVTQASNTVRRVLTQSGICTEDKLPKKVRDMLSDLDMVGNRLVFVTSVLTFEAQELVKDVEVAGLFQDIVAPVLAFSMDYAKHRNRTLRVDKSSLFYDVVCDAQAASMVFHMLIDNAIKYSKTNSTIIVRGEVSETRCSVVIENYGLPIMPEEREDIFRRYYRGRAAEQQKTDGSGIGLYLAREIMSLNHGDVILRRSSAPTVFVLSIERARKERR